MTGQLRIRVCDGNDVHIVTLRGELDVFSGDAVFEVLTEIAGSTVIVDLSELTFIDAAGLGAIIAAKNEIERGGNKLELGGASGMVRRVFEVEDLGYLLAD